MPQGIDRRYSRKFFPGNTFHQKESAVQVLLVTVKFFYRIDHGYDIFDRRIRLNDMYRVKYKAAVLSEYLTSSEHLLADLFWSTEGKHPLCVYSAAPEGNIFSEFILQFLRIHMIC